MISTIFEDPDFRAVLSHGPKDIAILSVPKTNNSIRKCTTTYTRRVGCDKGSTDHGPWRKEANSNKTHIYAN